MAPQNKKLPHKFYHHFLFKALILTIFLVIIPLFPSEPPDFVASSIFTRGWELIHLVFVGIAVSYGLFSRKNDASDGQNNAKFDNTQSYMSKLLHVTSVFDDEADISASASTSRSSFDNDNDNDDHVKKVQTWSSQYVRNEPMLIVADKNTVINNNTEKPLLLPVRSLKSRVCNEKDGDGVARVYTRSNTTPIVANAFSSNDLIDLVHGEDSGINSRGHNRSNSSNNFKEFSGGGGGSSESNSNSNNSEVSRSMYRSNSSLMSSRGFSRNSRRRSSGSSHGELDDGGVGESSNNVKVEQNVVLPSPIPWRSRSGRLEMRRESNESSPPPKLSSPRNQSSSSTSILESEAKSVEDSVRRKSNYSYNSRPPPPPPLPPSFQKSKTSQLSSHKGVEEARNGPSIEVKLTNGVTSSASVGRPKEVESAETERHETESSFSEYPKETRDFLERILLESDDESESEGESYKQDRMETMTKVDTATSEIVSDEGPDVDKKADEFIAKFREQIRLQRIESIKKSTGQLNRTSVR